MTKQEYLEKLRVALAENMPEMQQEVLEDYETHFDMGLKNGKTEEQLCEELGDVDEFIAELAQMEGIDLQARKAARTETSERPETPEAPEAPETAEAEEIPHVEDAEEIGPDEQRGWKTEGGKKDSRSGGYNVNWSGAFADIQNGVNEALNSVQDFLQQKNVQDIIHQGEEMLYQSSAIIQEKVQEYFKGPAFEGEGSKTEGSKENTKDVMSESREGMHKNLVLEGLSADILVEPSEDDKIHINYENMGAMKQRMQYRFYFREEGETIYAGIRKSKTAAGIFWGTFSPSMELTIKLPATAQMIELNTQSGSINMKSVNAKEFRVTTASGNVKMYKVQADAMRASAMSGDIQADQMSVRCLEIQSKSGDVQVDELTGDAVLLKSMSGDVRVSHVNCQELSMSSISGDAIGRNIRAEQMACTSTSGDSEIQGEFQRCRVESVSGDATLTTGRDLEASVSSVSGDVRMNLSNEGRGFEADYQTVSGELEVRYGGEHQYLTRNGRLEKGEKGSRIYLKTVSGDMVISD